ncbi:GNAT family N-acetyltransferase [Moraxella marmotae]|uniref:GNAT family N-acetyltransferase n=1 Tax=Moraxella marmotae TaxID=3344520 RepID=UPI0035F324DD
MTQISIRATENYDFQGMYDLYRQEIVALQMLNLPNQSLHAWQKRLADIPSNVHSFVAILDTDEDYQIIGNAALRTETNPRRRHIGNFVIAVSESHQGQGVGSQLMRTILDLADNWLNLKRVELTVYTDNEKAITLYQKFGFIIEGEHQKFAFRNGEFVNAYTMARIKE